MQVKSIFGFVNEDHIGKVMFPPVQVPLLLAFLLSFTCTYCLGLTSVQQKQCCGTHSDMKLICKGMLCSFNSADNDGMPPKIEHLGSTSRISVVMDQEEPIPKIVEGAYFAAELRELLAIGHLVTTRKACTSDFLQTILAQVPELWAA